MTAGLQQQAKLKQSLAPQLRQGVKLLAMSLPELRSELLAEMAKNPVIDDVEPTLEKATISQRETEDEALAALRTLEPRPGRAYRTSPRGTEYVNPEVHAVKSAGRWTAQVDDRSLPEIRISSRYVKMLEDPNCAPETKTYVRERIAAAKAVVEAVAKRQETIVKIAQAIFDRQPGFFTHGLRGLKPMTMQEVVDVVGVSLSTVSRTVNGKYTSTPKGTVELARFFAHGITTDSGETVTTDGVIDRLRELVADEDPTKPLSDEKLSALLKAEGFPVARRTVAKYRGIAGIPGTTERRRS